MQVIGAVQRSVGDDAIVVCAAGGLPGELHKLWKTGAAERLSPRVRLLAHGLRDRRRPRGQDGRSPDREVVVMVGDGSYMMLNSELPRR